MILQGGPKASIWWVISGRSYCDRPTTFDCVTHKLLLEVGNYQGMLPLAGTLIVGRVHDDLFAISVLVLEWLVPGERVELLKAHTDRIIPSTNPQMSPVQEGLEVAHAPGLGCGIGGIGKSA